MSNAALTHDLPLDYADLGNRIDGDVVLPGDEGWDDARRAWNLAVDQRPVAVAFPESPDDVAAVVRFARAAGLRVAPQATGHGAPALGPLSDTILLRTSRLRDVSIDPDARVARVEAGAEWQEVTRPAAEHGLAALAGSSPDVGVVGYTLGGGMGWLARKLGLAANSVTAVELVTADGELRRVDADHDPDLFWAVRGGGGSFGIVTALELRLFPIEQIFAGTLFWPIERAGEVLHAWRRWVRTVPDEVTSVGRIMQFPPLPQVPEPFRGRSFVLVEAAMLLDARAGAELLEPLRALEPALDTFATIPSVELQQLHMDPPEPVPGVGDGMLLSDLTADTVDAIAAVAGPDARSPFVSFEVRHLGGELARPSAGNGALAAIDAGFAVFAVGVPATPDLATALEIHLEHVRRALARWDAGSYFNFTESRTDPRRFWSEQAYHRLRRVKAAFDAGDVIRANHGIA